MQEEETLLNEMEVTGQAFEDMQDQNIRLIQQLREKDDANFKLMSERIKSNQINKLANEERDNLSEQVKMEDQFALDNFFLCVALLYFVVCVHMRGVSVRVCLVVGHPPLGGEGLCINK